MAATACTEQTVGGVSPDRGQPGAWGGVSGFKAWLCVLHGLFIGSRVILDSTRSGRCACGRKLSTNWLKPKQNVLNHVSLKSMGR